MRINRQCDNRSRSDKSGTSDLDQFSIELVKFSPDYDMRVKFRQSMPDKDQVYPDLSAQSNGTFLNMKQNGLTYWYTLNPIKRFSEKALGFKIGTIWKYSDNVKLFCNGLGLQDSGSDILKSLGAQIKFNPTEDTQVKLEYLNSYANLIHG